MNRAPLVSALICTYNADRFIEDTLRSVWGQSYPNIEILIVDNASRDGTYEKLQALARDSPMPMHLIKAETNLGIPAGLNTLLDRANGAYAAILDHDDFWHRDKTRVQVEFLEAHPQYPGCGGQTYVWWEQTGRVSLFKVKEHDSLTFHGTLMFRIRPEWRYDPQLFFRADPHFTQDVLCAEGRQIYNFQKPLAVWRMRADGNNLSRRWYSMKPLWSYWRRTRNHVETAKGIAGRILPDKAIDFVLRARHSVSELHAGDAELQGFPPPLGPRTVSADEQV
jgi:glycosyltransferase involved in cell wall biosynthesis